MKASHVTIFMAGIFSGFALCGIVLLSQNWPNGMTDEIKGLVGGGLLSAILFSMMAIHDLCKEAQSDRSRDKIN